MFFKNKASQNVKKKEDRKANWGQFQLQADDCTDFKVKPKRGSFNCKQTTVCKLSKDIKKSKESLMTRMRTWGGTVTFELHELLLGTKR